MKVMGLDGEVFVQSFKVGFKIVPVGLAYDNNKDRQTEIRNEQKDKIADYVSTLSKENIRALMN